MEKIYGMHKLVGLQLFGSRTPTFSSGTPTFCQMGVLNSCFQNPSESSAPEVYSGEFVLDSVCWELFNFFIHIYLLLEALLRHVNKYLFLLLLHAYWFGLKPEIIDRNEIQ